MLTYILFVIGFVILIKWADMLVSWASSIALKFNIPAIVIWLTIVAFWTSTPELAVNIFSAIESKTDLAIWNILGSNIANILLILWITAFIYPVKAKHSTVWKEIPFALLWTLILWIMANDILIDWWNFNQISKIDWLIFIWFFIIFLYYTFGISKIKDDISPEDEDIKEIVTWKSIVFIFLWLTWLTIWWKWIVDGAVEIAKNFGMSETVIWLTVVAIWTSLPELATSIVAALKKQSDIAIWNIVWSNIFNIFWILWVTSIIKPLPFSESSNIDILMMIFATIILFLTMFIWKKHTICKWQWALMFLIYIWYIWYLVINI